MASSIPVKRESDADGIISHLHRGRARGLAGAADTRRDVYADQGIVLAGHLLVGLQELPRRRLRGGGENPGLFQALVEFLVTDVHPLPVGDVVHDDLERDHLDVVLAHVLRVQIGGRIGHDTDRGHLTFPLSRSMESTPCA